MTPEQMERLGKSMRQVGRVARTILNDAARSVAEMARYLQAAGLTPPPHVTRAPVLPRGRHGSRVQRSIHREQAREREYARRWSR